MRQHVPLSHAFPLPAPTRFQACVVIIAFWVHVCVCVCVAHVSFGAMRSPQFAVVAIWSRLRSDSISFPLGALFCWLFLFLHGLQCTYIHMYISVPAFYRHTCVCVRVRQLLSPGRKRGSLSPPLSLSWGNSILIFMVFFELAIILAL